MGERFLIQVYFNGRMLRFNVEVVHKNLSFDHFIIKGKNRAITIQSNKPLLITQNLLKKRVDWKLIEGVAPPSKIIEEIIQQLEQYYKGDSKGGQMEHLRRKP